MERNAELRCLRSQQIQKRFSRTLPYHSNSTIFLHFPSILWKFRPLSLSRLFNLSKVQSFVISSASFHYSFLTYSSLLTCKDLLGRRLDNFLAAASIEAAAPNSSVSAMTVGSSGSIQLLPLSCSAIETNSVRLCAIRREMGGRACLLSAIRSPGRERMCRTVWRSSRYWTATSWPASRVLTHSSCVSAALLHPWGRK